MPEITFLTKGVRFTLPRKKKTSEWLSRVAKRKKRKIESLTLIFSSDPFVFSLNRKYLNHDTLTDIITFDYSESAAIVGEIYISIPRVRENARIFSQPFEKELRRVMVHGLLHILGFRDKTARQVAQMRREEEACLSLW